MDENFYAWLIRLSFYIGQTTSVQYKSILPLADASKLFSLRWFRSYGVTKIQVFSRFNQMASVGGVDPFTYSISNRGTEFSNYELVEKIIISFFPFITIETCSECGNRFLDNGKCSDCQQTIADKSGYVYLAGNHGLLVYKIGSSRRPKQRVRILSALLPYSLELLHYFPADNALQAEKALHSQFSLDCLEYEWYRLTTENLDKFLAIKQYENGILLTNG